MDARSETDEIGDLEAIDVPTLVLHGDDDQVVPIADPRDGRSSCSSTARSRSTRDIRTAPSPSITT